MASADEYAAWIVANKDKKGTPEFETVAKAYREASAPAQAAPEEDDISWWDEASFAFDSADADWQSWGRALEAKFPMGRVSTSEGYQSPEELYGPEFMEMSYEDRLAVLNSRKEQALEEEYADIIEMQEEGLGSASAEVVGSITKTLASPSTFLLFGNKLLGAITTGMFLGAETETGRQLAAGEDLSVGDIAKQTAIGGATGAVANKVEKAARYLYGKRQSVKADKALDRKAESFNREVLDAQVKGASSQDSIVLAANKLGLDEREVLDLAASGKIKKPTSDMVEKARVAKDGLIPAVRKKANLVERLATPISSRVKDISEPVFGRLRKLEFNTKKRLADIHAKTDKFLERASKLHRAGDENYLRFERALMNNQRSEAKEIAQEYFPEIADSVDEIGGVLDDLYRDLSDSGLDIGYSEGYFPRKVKDMDGLVETLGRDLSSELGKFLDKKAAAKGLSGRAELSEDARDLLTNQFLSGRAARGEGLSIVKERRIEELTPELQKHYHSAPESFARYIDKAVRETEKRRFFGEYAKQGDDGVDLDKSIGALIAKEDLSPGQADDLRLMLSARFNEGELASHDLVATARNVQTAALLGQFDSAMIQLGDVGTSMYLNGLGNTIKAALGRKGALTADELGVIQNVAADVEANGFMSRVVQESLKWSGFRAVDRFGKNTLMTAAHKKNTALARKSPEKISEKWGQVFGNETGDLIKDLQRGEMTDNVKFLLFNELSDAQPITLSEMPESYLNAPNGRIFYALKSFALKQLDLVKRTAIDEMRRGNYLEGFSMLVKYSATMGLSGGVVGTVRDMLQTKEVRPEQLPDKSFETLMGIAFLNDYARNKYILQGDVAGYFENMLLPAAPGVVTEVIQSGIEAAKDEEDRNEAKFNKAIKDIPVFGKMAYYWYFGGAERKLERERKEEIREARRKAGIN